jgi:hypothetical protein
LSSRFRRVQKPNPRRIQAKVLNNSKPYSLRLKVIEIENSFRTNPKEPLKIWVHKCDIVYVSGMLHGKVKAPVMVSRQWFLMTHDRRKAYVPNTNHERGRHCEFWRKPERQECWYEDYW